MPRPTGVGCRDARLAQPEPTANSPDDASSVPVSYTDAKVGTLRRRRPRPDPQETAGLEALLLGRWNHDAEVPSPVSADRDGPAGGSSGVTSCRQAAREQVGLVEKGGGDIVTEVAEILPVVVIPDVARLRSSLTRSGCSARLSPVSSAGPSHIAQVGWQVEALLAAPGGDRL